MPRLSKTVATAVAAALLAACPVVATAADAHPVKSHTNTHRHSHATHDKLTGPRRGASHAIGAQLKAARALANRAASLTLTDAETLTALQDALAADVAAVQADLDAVAGAGSVRALHTLMAGAITSRQVARLQFEVVVEADAAIAEAGALGTTIGGLMGQLVDVDASADIATLMAATATLDTVSHQATGAISYVLHVLTATSPRDDVHAESEAWDALQQSLADDLAAVTDTVATIQANYGP